MSMKKETNLATTTLQGNTARRTTTPAIIEGPKKPHNK